MATKRKHVAETANEDSTEEFGGRPKRGEKRLVGFLEGPGVMVPSELTMPLKRKVKHEARPVADEAAWKAALEQKAESTRLIKKKQSKKKAN